MEVYIQCGEVQGDGGWNIHSEGSCWKINGEEMGESRCVIGVLQTVRK